MPALRKTVIFCMTLIITAAIAVLVYDYVYPTVTFNMRLSIEVEKDGVRRVGSSVINFRADWGPTFGLISPVEYSSSGEAAYLDLGHGDNLFVLLGLVDTSEDITNIILKTYIKNGGRYLTARRFYETLKAADEDDGETHVLSGELMPRIVSFANLNSRASIRAVDPSNLGATYPGVSLFRVTLTVTKCPVTRGVVEDELPWLRSLIGDKSMDNLPSYWVQKPELSQDRVFYTGFVRK